MEVKSILCDAATVRENLIHILGGGITRIWRPQFPAKFTGAVAIMIHPHPSEVGVAHSFVVLVRDADGGLVHKVEGELMVSAEGYEPGEAPVIPAIVDFSIEPPLTIPKAGSYSIDVLVDQQHKDSLAFVARLLP